MASDATVADGEFTTSTTAAAVLVPVSSASHYEASYSVSDGAKQQRAEALAAQQARDAAASLSAVALPALPRPGRRAAPAPQRAHLPEASASVDLSRARGVFGTKCALCHPLKVVEAAPPASEREARELVARMVKNGLRASEDELDLIVRHLLTLTAPR